MPITILDYVRSRLGDRETYSEEDHWQCGVAILGGCGNCYATIASYNAYPSRSGYWRCADCIGSTGYASTEEFASQAIRT